MFENANLHGTIWKDVKDIVHMHFNFLYKKYKEFYLNQIKYWDNERKNINDFCKKNDLDYKIYFYHNKIKKNK
jgi:hypothetical protein